MSGIVCLQGGREFTPDCVAMDREVLAAAPEGPVVVLAGAARPGSDYAGASRRASDHYRRIGVDLVTAPDPREDPSATLAALQQVGLLVLPGGAPASLREVLRGALEQRVRGLHAEGTAISGASAGAMVLCERMVLPSRGHDTVAGLGLAPGLALVHWDAGRTPSIPGSTSGLRWGLPECGGVLLETTPGGRTARAVGRGTPSIVLDGRLVELPRDHAHPI